MSIEQPTDYQMWNGSTELGYSDSLDVTNSNFSGHWMACH